LDSDEDCDEIAKLQVEGIEISAKLAKAQASGPLAGIGIAAICAGLLRP
jgi:hypothetical protein